MLHTYGRLGLKTVVFILIIAVVVTSMVLAGNTPSDKGGTQKESGTKPGSTELPQIRSLRPIGSSLSTDLGGNPLAPQKLTGLTLSNQFPQKAAFAGRPNVPGLRRQGGDDVSTATVIPALPYFNSGTTLGYGDDYHELCPEQAGSPDVVYSFHADSLVYLTISLCGSSYDTRLWVYENTAVQGTAVACNDDYCGYQSQVTVTATAGNDYYIVVDGWGGDYGSYVLDIQAGYPFDFSCPPGTVAENEPCVVDELDTFNGGCNSSPEVYSSIGLTDTVCGTSWSGDLYRDTDWYLHTFTNDTLVTWKAVAGFPVQVAIINLSGGCGSITFVTASGSANDTVGVSWQVPAGSYAFFVSPASHTGDNNCTQAASQYFAWIECHDPVVGPPNDHCANATAIGDVAGLPFSTVTASWDGYGTYVNGSPDIWYCYTATCNGTVTVDICDVDYDSKLVVWDGCTCPPITALVGSDDACGAGSKVTFVATAGQTYKIQIGGFGTESGSGTMTVYCTPVPPESFCSNVAPQTLPATFTGDATGAINECYLLDGGNVWAAFTIDTCTDVFVDYCGTMPALAYNAWLVLIQGCPCGTAVNASSYDISTCPDGNLRVVFNQLQPGTYYYPILNDPDYPLGQYTVTITGTAVECSYCTASSDVCDEFISRVTLGDIDNSSGCLNYSDYTSLSTPLFRGIGATLTVENGVTFYASDVLAVWADWNQDLDFNDVGEAQVVSGTPGVGPYTALINPPPGALLGPTRLRIRLGYAEALDPCGSNQYGEVEDYTIEVQDFVCGDVTGDMAFSIEDLNYMIDYYYDYAPAPSPWQAGDVNCDGILDIGDIEAMAYMLNGWYYPPCCPPLLAPPPPPQPSVTPTATE